MVRILRYPLTPQREKECRRLHTAMLKITEACTTQAFLKEADKHTTKLGSKSDALIAGLVNKG
jgi:hypothetical protein